MVKKYHRVAEGFKKEDNSFEYYKKISRVIIRSYNPKYWEPDLETRKRIDEKWQEKLKKNPNIYPGDLLRAVNIEFQKDGTMIIDTQLSTYKEHNLTMAEPDINKRGNCIYVGGDIVTSDKKMVFGLDNKVLKIIGGGVNPRRDIIFTPENPNGKPNPEIGLTREIWEETGIHPSHYNLFPDHVVFVPEERHPLIMYLVKLVPNSKKVEELFEDYKKECSFSGKPLEVSEIVCLGKYEIGDILEDFEIFSPKDKAEIEYIQENVEYFLS